MQNLHEIECFALIPHPTAPAWLMQRTAEGWRLPSVMAPQGSAPHVAHLNRRLLEVLGLKVTTLRHLRQADRQDAESRRLYLMENHTATVTPPTGWEWVGADRSQEPLATPEFRSALAAAGWEYDQRVVPIRRVPWADRGWFREASTWIADRLRAMRVEQLGPVEQIRTWELSCLLRVETIRGPVWFKAVPPVLAREVLVTSELSCRYPYLMPGVLAADYARRWLLLDDFHGPLLAQQRDLPIWEILLRRYADLQIGLSERMRVLVDLCPDRTLPVMARSLDRLVDGCQGERGLDTEAAAQLRELVPHLKEMCQRLETYRIPYSLDHGDLHPGNVALSPDRLTIFDWSGASVAHPFMSIIPFLNAAIREESFPEMEGARERLLQAYLEPWTRFEPMDRLREAFGLCEALGMLHQALYFHETILPHAEESPVWVARRNHWLMGLLAKHLPVGAGQAV